MSELFRREVIEHRAQRLYGEVRLSTPTSQWYLICLILVIVLAAGAALVFGEYPRKETVPGWLTPDKGLVRLFAGQVGVIEQVHVLEGTRVERGAPLVTLSLDDVFENGVGAGQKLLEGIDEEAEALKRHLALLKSRFKVDLQTARTQRDQYALELSSLRSQVDIQEKQVVREQQNLERISALVAKRTISEREQERRRGVVLQQQARFKELEHATLRKQGEITAQERRITKLPLQREIAVAQLHEKLSALAQRRTEIKRKARTVVQAPVSGRVASILVSVGQQVRRDTLQLTILPEGSKFQAEVFVPSRAAGFIEKGQRVRLLYDAFPFTRFGAANGKITRVSKSILDPREVNAAVTLTEPVFRLTVALDRQDVVAYGDRFDLQAGMTLKADLILEERRLWQMLVEPLRAAAR